MYRPLRERSPATILKVAEDSLHATGYDELSLLSLSTGDYSCVEPLLTELMARYAHDRIAVSLPSLRLLGCLDETLFLRTHGLLLESWQQAKPRREKHFFGLNWLEWILRCTACRSENLLSEAC